jgi:hypothetical protein
METEHLEWGRKLNRIYGILVLALVISLVTVSAYFIPMAFDNQARINNLMCRTVREWSDKMETVAGSLIPYVVGGSLHFPTVTDAQAALGASADAQFVASTLIYGGDLLIYEKMGYAAYSLESALMYYANGYPTNLNLSESAYQIAGSLSQEIFNITRLTKISPIENPNGTSPARIFDGLNSTDQIINHCDSVVNLASQLKAVSVKFAYPQ